MPETILVYEVLGEDIGEVWDHIEFDAKNFKTKGNLSVCELKCDFTLPQKVTFGVKTPNDRIDHHAFELPSLKYDKHDPLTMLTDAGFEAMPELKKKWEQMPSSHELVWHAAGRDVSIVCVKRPIERVFHSVLGEIYIYCPRYLKIVSSPVR